MKTTKFPDWIDKVGNQVTKVCPSMNQGVTAQSILKYANHLEPSGVLYIDFLDAGLVEVVFKCGTIRSFNASEAWMN